MNEFLIILVIGFAPIAPPADITFADGSMVKMVLKEKFVDVQTKFGNLVIPIRDIHRIDFGKTDTVQTKDGPFTGLVNNPKILASSPYFGEVLLKRQDLRTIQVRTNIGLEVEKVIQPDEPWAGSGVVVMDGDRFIITAIGQVDLWPQGPGQYLTGPKGYNTPGRNSPYAAGALMGKIGNKVFLIGERWEGIMPGAGDLQLSIVLSPWDNISQGNYRVKIQGR